jgi:3alpha(or 20beta)-hydroxysteroid dehydrogenase
MGRLDGKVVLVTGGARGQGAAEGRRCAAEGATVVLTDVLDDEGAATAAAIGVRAEYRHHDVTDPAAWTAVADGVLDRHGRIDVLVNNAGVFRILGLLDTDPQEWDRIVAVNQTGVFLGMRAVAPAMMAAGRGSIVNISSMAGLQGTSALAYSATKWAVRGLTRSAARELGPHGVRVNSVHPGLIDTAMLDELGDRRSAVAQRVPLGRVATADEVADLVLFLASDESSYCTGHEFVVDGGMTA